MNAVIVERVVDSRASWGDVYERFKRMRYEQSLVDKILSVETAWEEWLDHVQEGVHNFAELHAELSFTVTQKAKKWERRFGRNGYSEDDFAAVMWAKIWTICQDYNQAEAEYLLFEIIRVSLDNAVKDYLRKEKRLREREANAWAEWKAQRGARNELYDEVETGAVNRLLVQQILTDDILTDGEKGLLFVIYDNPDASMREVGRVLGHGDDAMKSQRMLERIRNRLLKVYGHVLES